MSTLVELLKADITEVDVDVIVNAANTSLLGGGGVDGAIHRAAGRKLLEACIALGGCPTGEAKITPGFDLPARFVIHTPGPVWHGGSGNEEALLVSCYYNSLSLAQRKGLHSIAFPSISTGAYRFPLARAAALALDTVNAFVAAHPDAFEKIVFVLFSDKDLECYRAILKKK